MNKIPEKIGQLTVDRLITGGRISNLLIGSGSGIPGWPAQLVIKHLRDEYARDQQLRGQFLETMGVWARLRHPSIVRVLGSGWVGGQCYGAMELVEGWNLLRVLENDGDPGLPPPLAAYVVAQVAGALETAHQTKDEDDLQICPAHGGINPFNVLLSTNGQVKVIDFQMYRVGNVGSPKDSCSRIRTSFLSPEQCSSLDPDHRSDVFSAGALLYALATGRMPFLRSSRIETLQAVMQVQYANPSDLVNQFPEELAKIIARALSRKAGDRYRSCGHLKDALEKYLATAGGVRQQIVLADYLWRHMGEPGVDDQGVVAVADGGAAGSPDEAPSPAAGGTADRVGKGKSRPPQVPRGADGAGSREAVADLFNPWSALPGGDRGDRGGVAPPREVSLPEGRDVPAATVDSPASSGSGEPAVAGGDPLVNPYAAQFAMLGQVPIGGGTQTPPTRVSEVVSSPDVDEEVSYTNSGHGGGGGGGGADAGATPWGGGGTDQGHDSDWDDDPDFDPAKIKKGMRHLLIGAGILVAVVGFLWLTKYMGQGEERTELLARSQPPAADEDGTGYRFPPAPEPDGVLSVTTDPANAQVLVAYSLVEREAGQATSMVPVRTGHHLKVIVSASGYVSHHEMVHVPEGHELTQVKVELARAPAGSPQVTLNLEPEDPDQQYLEAREGAEGGRGAGTGTGKGGAPDDGAQVGTVAVESVPDGAMIYYEGSVIGTTPSRFTMPAGNGQVLVFRKEGHTPHVAVFDLKANAASLVRVNMGTVDLDGERRELALHSRPELARVVRDGSYVGSTPQYVRDSVNRVVPIRFTHPNHTSQEATFVLRNNSITYVAMLERVVKAKGLLSVESTEPVTVYVGNSEIGPTPVRDLELEMGTHSVALSNERKELRAYFEVEIIPGEKVRRKAVWRNGQATIQ